MAQRAETELIQFNIVNILVADALAPCVAKTSISTHDIDYIGYVKFLSFNYVCHVIVEAWYQLKIHF